VKQSILSIFGGTFWTVDRSLLTFLLLQDDVQYIAVYTICAANKDAKLRIVYV